MRGGSGCIKKTRLGFQSKIVRKMQINRPNCFFLHIWEKSDNLKVSEVITKQKFKNRPKWGNSNFHSRKFLVELTFKQNIVGYVFSQITLVNHSFGYVILMVKSILRMRSGKIFNFWTVDIKKIYTKVKAALWLIHQPVGFQKKI